MATPSAKQNDDLLSCKLLHHGAAASSSCHTLLWIPGDENDATTSIVYASHGILNICAPITAVGRETVWTVTQTLRSSTTNRIITAIAGVYDDQQRVVGLLSGFSDGTVNLWWKKSDTAAAWSNEEHVLLAPGKLTSITDIEGIKVSTSLEDEEIARVVVCTATGVYLLKKDGAAMQLGKYAANTVKLARLPNDLTNHSTLLLVGTAAPRYNKIHVYYWINDDDEPKHVGNLMGHEDWLSDFAWHVGSQNTALLASASQDARIRLWNFQTTTVSTSSSSSSSLGYGMEVVTQSPEMSTGDEEFDNFAEDDQDDEGEARLEVIHGGCVTRVTLEAILYGHEEAVTSVCWHPKPQELYRQDRVLLSSSMDRTLLIWACTTDIWTPLTRVGAAGGILGGSIGSTLLGFVAVGVEPTLGESLIGQAYGGAIHVWSLEREQSNNVAADMSSEEIALLNKWKVTPCITGHFGAVTDCCWEAYAGEYLLTVSTDQTCRLWAPVATDDDVADVWVELARPQVHGYDLSTLTSISTRTLKHRLVTGANEKEIRFFDAPMTTVRVLDATKVSSVIVDDIERVERAYIPSLGLSNKASAADGAEEDTGGIEVDENQLHLPLERDLGAVSLWPEAGKLFGHNTEIYRLTSTVSAMSGQQYTDSPFASETLVASTAKARDEKDASIRIWQVDSGKCVQVLKDGHKSTISAICFSADGRYLASSGKDRRLCIWSRTETTDESIEFVLATAIVSAHKRIVWSAHFCPSDPKLLASGSRDGTIKIWRILSGGKDEVKLEAVASFEPFSRPLDESKKVESVTALAFAPKTMTIGGSPSTILAVGLESGLIELWQVNDTCRVVHCIDPSSCHLLSVTKLCWRPIRDESSQFILASSSADHGCRLYKFNES